MHFGLQTWGTLGDVQPMLKIGGALRQRGHRVTLAITSIDGQDYTAHGTALGIEVIHAPANPPNALADIPEQLQKHRRQPMIKLLLDQMFFPLLPEMQAAAQQLCQHCDGVLGHFLVFPLKAAAQAAKRPHATLTPWPGIIPGSDELPLPLPGPLQHGTPLRWSLVQHAIDLLLKRRVSPVWRDLGLPAPHHVLSDAWHSDQLNLVTASPALWGTPTAWSANHHLVGALETRAELSGPPLPESLQAFLKSGEKPVLMTMGSMQGADPERGIARLIGAAREIGCRAIIQTRLTEYLHLQQHRDLYFIDHVDHQRLLPQCRAILHHGGAGTTQSAIRHGIPSAVLAFIPEQLSWGRQLLRAGVAAKPLLYREQTTISDIAAALRRVLTTPEMTTRAQRLAEQVRHEDGLTRSVSLLEAFIASPQQQPKAPTKHAPRTRHSLAA